MHAAIDLDDRRWRLAAPFRAVRELLNVELRFDGYRDIDAARQPCRGRSVGISTAGPRGSGGSGTDGHPGEPQGSQEQRHAYPDVPHDDSDFIRFSNGVALRNG